MADLKQRICIIGAGPAGLSAAMYLRKKDTLTMSSTKNLTK